jgi:hypothetical protein
MVFGKRRWATGVAREAALAPDTPAGKIVIALLTVSSKRAQRLARTSGPRSEMDDLDFVAMAARALPTDADAVARIEKTLDLPKVDAERLLAQVAVAANRFYQDEGRDLGAPRPDRVREPWTPPAR